MSTDSAVNIVEISKMRKLNDARRDWERRHCSNSPFRLEAYGSSSSVDFGSVEGSPIDVRRGLALRAQIAKGDQYMTTQTPKAISNSKFYNKSATKKASNVGTSNNSPLPGTHNSTRLSSGSQESLSPRPCSVEDEILEGFADSPDGNGEDTVLKEGPCYLKTKTDRFKEHWVVLNGNEIFCYRNAHDSVSRVMHCLAGTFVKEIDDEKCPDTKRTLYPVKIVLPPNKSRILYFVSREEQKSWLSSLLSAMGFSNLYDFYELGRTLGKGQFGMVKLATHKVSGVQAAIKTVMKANMRPVEVFQQRREIEVLKMCQHNSIIRLIDLFENSDTYFIVLEYMQGKDLFDYIQKRDFSLPEQRVQELTYRICLGVQYLHEFGIVHRDLKLENIMMSDSSDLASPKIVDFGLAKIIGPSNTASEPFGTLGYVAPEVLQKQPYTFSCDLWSIGCIIYALLSGSLPFDHENQKETIRMTLEDPLVFDLPCWDDVSDMAKDLITKLLVKDPKRRLSLNSAMEHPWFSKVRAKHAESSQLLADRRC